MERWQIHSSQETDMNDWNQKTESGKWHGPPGMHILWAGALVLVFIIGVVVEAVILVVPYLAEFNDAYLGPR